MSRARDFADLAGSADAGGLTGRNMVVNGSMVISQRGTSFTGVADNAYTLDRFQMVENFGAVVDVSQASDAPSEGGFTKSLKVDVTTSATPTGSTSLVVMHKIEGQNFIRAGFGTSGAQPLTLSFWVKSNVTGTYRVNFFNLNGTGNKIVGGTYTINTASTWEKKTIAIPADTAQATYLTNAEGFRIEFYLASGPDRTSGALPTDWIAYDATRRAAGHAVNVASSTDNEWYITGVQLEVGEQATPFDHSESYGETLAKCQRYFFAQQAVDGEDYYAFGVGFAEDASTFRAFSSFPVTMRVEPSLTATVSNTFFAAFFTPNSNAVLLDQGGRDGAYANIYGSGGTAGKTGRWLADNVDAAYLFWSAEL